MRDRSSIRLYVTVVLVVLAIAALIAFKPQSTPTPPSVASGPPVRLGHFPNVTHAQPLVARATGDFEKTLGVPVEWSTFNAGPTAIEALFAGEIDATYIGPNPAINGYIKSRGEAFVIVAGAASGGAALVVAPHAGIKSNADFHGKTVATPQLGNTQDVAARVYFAEHGLQSREKGGDLTIQPLANPDQLLLFQKKQIDAAWTIEPWVSRLEQEAGGKLLLHEKELWPDGRYVTTHLIISRRFLKERPDLARKLIEAHVDLTQRINADKQWASGLINDQIKQLTGKALPLAVLKSAVDRVEVTYDPVASSLRKSAQDAHKIGFIKEEPNLDGIYELSILNEVLKSRGLAEVKGR